MFLGKNKVYQEELAIL